MRKIRIHKQRIQIRNLLISLFLIIVFSSTAFAQLSQVNALDGPFQDHIDLNPFDAYIAYLEQISPGESSIKLTGLNVTTALQRRVEVDRTDNNMILKMAIGKDVSLTYVDYHPSRIFFEVNVVDFDKETLGIKKREQIPFKNPMLANGTLKGLEMKIGKVKGVESKVVAFASDNSILLAQKIGNSWFTEMVLNHQKGNLYSDVGLDLITENDSIVGAKIIARLSGLNPYGYSIFEIDVDLSKPRWKISQPKPLYSVNDLVMQNGKNRVSFVDSRLSFTSDTTGHDYFAFYQKSYGWSQLRLLGSSIQNEILGDKPTSVVVSRVNVSPFNKLRFNRIYGSAIIHSFEITVPVINGLFTDFAINSKYRKNDYKFMVVPVSFLTSKGKAEIKVYVIDNDQILKTIPLNISGIPFDVEVELAQ